MLTLMLYQLSPRLLRVTLQLVVINCAVLGVVLLLASGLPRRSDPAASDPLLSLFTIGADVAPLLQNAQPAQSAGSSLALEYYELWLGQATTFAKTIRFTAQAGRLVYVDYVTTTQLADPRRLIETYGKPSTVAFGFGGTSLSSFVEIFIVWPKDGVAARFWLTSDQPQASVRDFCANVREGLPPPDGLIREATIMRFDPLVAESATAMDVDLLADRLRDVTDTEPLINGPIETLFGIPLTTPRRYALMYRMLIGCVK